MEILAVIPARFASSRFPGKPLAIIAGQSMISRVWERVRDSGIASRVIVATDDERILNHVNDFGGEALLTSASHPSGTDRVAEAAGVLKARGYMPDIILNVQGDEPGLQPASLRVLAEAFIDPEVQIATLVSPAGKNEDTVNPSVVKVVMKHNGDALYFSRQLLPFIREPDTGSPYHYYLHHGIYGFRAEILQKLATLPQGRLEHAEKLEQLRWLEHGLSIRCVQVDIGTAGIDVPEDIDTFERNL